MQLRVAAIVGTLGESCATAWQGARERLFARVQPQVRDHHRFAFEGHVASGIRAGERALACVVAFVDLQIRLAAVRLLALRVSAFEWTIDILGGRFQMMFLRAAPGCTPFLAGVGACVKLLAGGAAIVSFVEKFFLLHVLRQGGCRHGEGGEGVVSPLCKT